MLNHQVTREQFQDAIEIGIRKLVADDIDDASARLRKVGREAPSFTKSLFRNCPLAQAELIYYTVDDNGNEELEPLNGYQFGFWHAFDQAIHPSTASAFSGDKIEVI